MAEVNSTTVMPKANGKRTAAEMEAKRIQDIGKSFHKPYRFFVRLSFVGTRYSGWAKQPSKNTVCDKLEHALRTLFQEPDIEVMGCGRTDKGVHASDFYAHFNLTELPDLTVHVEETKTGKSVVLHRLNCMLPVDISIHDIFRVKKLVSARLFAISRSYEYTVIRQKSSYHAQHAYLYRKGLNIANMQLAAERLLGTQDFSAFARTKGVVETSHGNFCTVTEAKFDLVGDGVNGNSGTPVALLAEDFQHSYSDFPSSLAQASDKVSAPVIVKLVFYISASRFLRNMVRSIVGTLLKVGNGQMTVEQFQTVISSGNRQAAASSAPAQGLALTKILYPEDALEAPVAKTE